MKNKILEDSIDMGGLWVRPVVYARLHGITDDVLKRWRKLDRKAGRSRPLPGYPEYRIIGARALRYWVPNARITADPEVVEIKQASSVGGA